MRINVLAAMMLGACGSQPAPTQNHAADRVASRQPAATLAVAQSGAGGCSVRWDGDPVDQEAVVERAYVLLSEAVRRLGGPEAITSENIPLVRVEAARETGWPCVVETLRSVQRVGFADVALRIVGDTAAMDRRANFILTGTDQPPVVRAVIRLRGNGPITFNEQNVQTDELGMRIGALGQIEWPDVVVLAPSADARFGFVYDAVDSAGVAAAPTLGSCRADAAGAGQTRIAALEPIAC